MTKEEIRKKFIRCVVNEHITINREKNIRQYYRRPDLDKWSEEFYNKGIKYFYTEPVDPNKPYGKLKLSERKVEYKATLTEEEFNFLFNDKGEKQI
jgi:hypothetical protein